MLSAFPGKQLFAAVLAFLAAASMWFFVRQISVPHQVQDGARTERPRGNLSDLYPRWLGARELLIHGRDPYSPEVTREIQRGYYGREIDPARPNDPKDQVGFAYPVYVVFLLAPTVRMNFDTVKFLSFWVLTILAIASVPIWERMLGLPLRGWRTLIAVVLLLGSYSFIEAIALQQPLLLVAALLAASFLARQQGWLVLSGVLLAIATIKPQVAFLPTTLMVMWVLGSWKARQRWLWGFTAAMLVLLAASEYVLRGWLFHFYYAVKAYRSYMVGTSFLDWLVTPRWSFAAWLLIVVTVVWAGWRVRLFAPDTFAARRVLCVALVAVVCTSPNLALYNQVLLLPGALLWFEHRKSWRSSGISARTLSRLLVALLAWPWIACGILITAKLLVRNEQFVQRMWQLPHYATLSLPIVLLTLLLIAPAEVSSQQTSPALEIVA
jgi:hypothetical protein